MANEPTLKRGHHNSHDWVVYAQKLLNQALAGGMHLDMAENGVFDEEMEQTIISFQERHGLGHDGEIGPKTWAALHHAVEAKHQAAVQAVEEEDDQLQSAPREVHNAPGHRDENTFHERKDSHGNAVRVYDVDSETVTVTPGTHADWNSVVSHMVELARINVETQVPYVHAGIMQFQQQAAGTIAQFAASAHQFEQDSHVEFPWGLLVDGLDTALAAVFTVEGGVGGWIYEKVKGAFVDQLVTDLTTHTSQVPGLQAKLEAGVQELVTRVHTQTKTAIDEIKAVLREKIEQDMQAHQQVTNDPEWIAAMVAYFGFPERPMADVVSTISSWLTQQFDAMVHAAQEELLANSG
jgi:Putative peptidoglycan binding domain